MTPDIQYMAAEISIPIKITCCQANVHNAEIMGGYLALATLIPGFEHMVTVYLNVGCSVATIKYEI